MPYVDPHIWNVQIQCSFLQNFTVESTSVNVIKKKNIGSTIIKKEANT